MQHDRGQRRSTNVTVQFFTRPATMGIGRVLNVSATGAFMESQLPLRILSLLYLVPMDPLPTDTTGGRIAATVVRCSATGVGLEWCEFGAETTEAYARLFTGSSGLVDEHQLSLPVLPGELHLSHRAAGSLELRHLCRVEFLD